MKKILILIAAATAIFLFYQFGGEKWLLPDTYRALYAEQPELTAGIYFFVYLVVAAFSIPGASLMTLIAGAIFGLVTGGILVSFASSLGATLAFLISRGLMQDWVQNKFGNYIEPINKGVEKEGGFYLFTLRLIPLFPFFVINLVMGVTKMRVGVFYLVSQIGMLPATLVYVNAGAQLADVKELSLSGIATPGLIIGLALLGIFPLIAKWIMDSIKSNRVYRPWVARKPKKFDTNMVVIGGGSAGLVAALIAAAVKAKVTLVERDKMGGDCLNTGCVPSKALIRSAQIKHYSEHADQFGIETSVKGIDFSKVMGRVQSVIKAIEPHDSIERFTGLGVDCVTGDAEIISPWEVKVGDKVISTRNIVIASGAEPFVPPIPGIDQIDYLTSDNLWALEELPKHLMVLGGGPIGCEMAQSFRRLGAEVTLVDMAPRMLPREDEDVSAIMTRRFEAEGIRILTGHKTKAFEVNGDTKEAVLESSQGEVKVAFDKVLVAVGRKARSQGMGFDTLGLETTPQGTLAVDDYLRTKYPNVFACGDIVGPYQFTHVASHQAWFATVNALFGKFKKFKVDYSVIPWATFTDPEVAHVGLSEAGAKEKGIEYEVTRYELDELDRAIADSETTGFVKVLTAPGKDRILGATIVGYQGGNLLAEFVLAMKHGIGLNKILGTIHIYPTTSEASKATAGIWKQANKPEKLLEWVAKFHARQL